MPALILRYENNSGCFIKEKVKIETNLNKTEKSEKNKLNKMQKISNISIDLFRNTRGEINYTVNIKHLKSNTDASSSKNQGEWILFKDNKKIGTKMESSSFKFDIFENFSNKNEQVLSDLKKIATKKMMHRKTCDQKKEQSLEIKFENKNGKLFESQIEKTHMYNCKKLTQKNQSELINSLSKKNKNNDYLDEQSQDKINFTGKLKNFKIC